MAGQWTAGTVQIRPGRCRFKVRLPAQASPCSLRHALQERHALGQHLVAIGRDGAPDAERRGDLGGRVTKLSITRSPLKPVSAQRAEHVVPVDGAGSRYAAIALAEMDVGRVLARDADAVTDALLLDVHVVGVEVDGDVRLVEPLEEGE